MIFKSCTFYACVFLSTWTTVLVVDGDTEGRDHVGGEMNSGFVYLQACILERVCEWESVSVLTHLVRMLVLGPNYNELIMLNCSLSPSS